MQTTLKSAKKPIPLKLDSPAQYLKGIGPKRAKVLASQEIRTVEDLLYYIPRKYLDRSTITPIGQLKVNSVATVVGRVIGYETKKGRVARFQAVIEDKTGSLTLVWFRGINYITNMFEPGDVIIASGEVRFYYGLQMAHPEFERISEGDEELIHTGRVIPVYPSSADFKHFGLDSRGLRRILNPLLSKTESLISEKLPDQVIIELGLMPLPETIRNIHFPDNLEMANKARQRLAFDEFFFFELMMALRKKKLNQKQGGIVFKPSDNLVRKLLDQLSFLLTPSQEKVLREISEDMTSTKVMNRLLQGDVGSGKTIVALIAMLVAVENGYQAALMAPTEILAEQHFINIHTLLEKLGLEVVLLTSSVKKNQKENILQKIENGTVQIIVGTHALIQESVIFHKLGLVVIDEQHRFGVVQRAKLRKKGILPDVLVMTATPIPRTLALTLYGDLDVSIIDQMPPGRKSIRTVWWRKSSPEELYKFLIEEISKGRQAYIVYPLVEESEKADLKAATESFHLLQEKVFPQLKLALIHGRIKSEEREKIMRDFRCGKYDILVATTVIEVGLDVPNATLMLIEHADRFGLSQLHQLRGRIGRGEEQSYCFFLTEGNSSLEAQQRLNTMVSTTDGFKIAEVDLKLRGPGEFFGTRQHGLPDFKIADLVNDMGLLYQAREQAFKLIKEDPYLKSEKNWMVKNNLTAKYKNKFSLIEVG
ncbi:MAG: ATP-dependent DNA helicase RecG [candidate division Zixibacteria bacterium]|nr:ATP-dependent DNA helicase RecG [candidate division Zixibacteria bacterium]